MAEANPPGAFERGSTKHRIDGSVVSVDFPFEIARLRADPAYEQERHTGRTLAKYPDLRVVLETMKPGARLSFHESAERTTLQVVVGQLRAWFLGGQSCDLNEGSFAAIDTARLHEIECLEECAFLLTLAWPPAMPLAPADEEAGGGGIKRVSGARGSPRRATSSATGAARTPRPAGP